MFVQAIASLVHIILISIFVGVLDMGWNGVCLATSLQFLSRFIIAQVYLQFIQPYKDSNDVKLFSRESSSQLGP